ncbi:uncharacterized protein LOC117572559 [Drosophila albomicans]|uniref:Uncharacterized protein LOC117572559 n=1 Tax=Drosophila albomicans TaxID=7291 RepID=A0A6P8X530_DROAB|nr:uncharacterized protein LOC117572559 [Drosophila albomicans]
MNLSFQQTYSKSKNNGTISLTTRQQVSPERLKELQSGAGELFLSSISKSQTVEQVMQVALQLGDVYKIRFKIDYSGSSRGYAYLQYLADVHIERTIKYLQKKFNHAQFKIAVCESRNIRKLLLKKVYHMTPLEVYEKLRQLNHYVKLVIIEYEPRRYAYIIIYRNSDEAGEAYAAFRSTISNFGPDAVVQWFDKTYKNRANLDFGCCQRVQRGEFDAQEKLYALIQAKCCCFSI